MLLKFLEEVLNPDLNPAVAEAGRPIADKWKMHWAHRAAQAVHFAGQHSPVTQADLVGAEFVEVHHDVTIFRLADGRYHVVSSFAVPSIEAARAAAVAVSGDTG